MKPLVMANWKMNLLRQDVIPYMTHLQRTVSGALDVCVAVPYTMLDLAKEHLMHSPIHYAAQDISAHVHGAYTSQVSGAMLSELGVSWVIVGHSECRLYQHQQSTQLTEKIQRAIESGINVVFCVGENQVARDSNTHYEVVSQQLKDTLAPIASALNWGALSIAYEPIWAIGTGVTATPSDAQAMHQVIRETLADLSGSHIASLVRILYGGSVTANNTAALMNNLDVNGVLVGGASLDVTTFSRIISLVSEVHHEQMGIG